MTVPFYKQKKDALDEVGITARQESHWRQSGLYQSEIGEGRFTQSDMQTLSFLRRLIVTKDKKGRQGLGLPIDTVKRLLDQAPAYGKKRRVPIAQLADPAIYLTHARHIDFFSGRFVTFPEVINQLFTRLWSSNRLIDQWVQTLAFFHFQALRNRYGSDPDIYDAHRNRFFEQIRRMDQITRAYTEEETYSCGYSPSLPSDPEPTGGGPLPPDDPVFQKFQDMEHECYQKKRRIAQWSGDEDYDPYDDADNAPW